MSHALLLQGCASDLDYSPNLVDDSAGNANVSERMISETRAIEIANGVVDSGETRSWTRSVKDIEYVCRKEGTRSIDCVSDTLAYVINYENNEGFAIISADNSVFPILAYSHDGNFSFDNEIAMDNFVSNIEAYIDSNAGTNIIDPKLKDYMEYYNVEPKIKCTIGQRSPWDKYVIEEHPGCPVGCVAVATALTLSHAKSYLFYHGEDFYFSSIVKALYEEQVDKGNTEASQDGTVKKDPIYDYKTAADRMAKFLYWIGKDLNMSYNPGGSSAFSCDVYTLFEELGISIPSGNCRYNQSKIIRYLQNDCIVFMDGCSPDNYADGHSWVCDGSIAIVNKENHSEIYQSYLHFDWGWDGAGNGYYSGEVFSAEGYVYKPTVYFAVSTRTWNTLVME